MTNPGVVNTMYIWKINMDEQYPKRYLGENSNVNSRQKMSESSSHVSKSFRGTLSAMSQRNYYEDDVSADDSKFFSQQCTSFITGNYSEKRISNLPFFVFPIIYKKNYLFIIQLRIFRLTFNLFGYICKG